MAIVPDLFGGLEQMLELGKIGIRVTVVHKGIKKFHRLPDAHLAARKGEEVLLLGLDEIVGLVEMIEAIKFANGGARIGFIISELLRLLVGINGLKWRTGPSSALRVTNF